MKILMLFHDFDVIDLLFHDFDELDLLFHDFEVISCNFCYKAYIPWILLMNLFKPTHPSDSLA
jgi:hypothetical protein